MKSVVVAVFLLVALAYAPVAEAGCDNPPQPVRCVTKYVSGDRITIPVGGLNVVVEAEAEAGTDTAAVFSPGASGKIRFSVTATTNVSHTPVILRVGSSAELGFQGVLTHNLSYPAGSMETLSWEVPFFVPAKAVADIQIPVSARVHDGTDDVEYGSANLLIDVKAPAASSVNLWLLAGVSVLVIIIIWFMVRKK